MPGRPTEEDSVIDALRGSQPVQERNRLEHSIGPRRRMHRLGSIAPPHRLIGGRGTPRLTHGWVSVLLIRRFVLP